MTGEELYILYRMARAAHGFAEPVWTTLDRSQQTVWIRVAAAITE